MGVGATEPSGGPALHLLAAQPAAGEGIDCAVDDLACGVPIDTEIRLRLDRALLPASGVRQAIRVYTGSRENAAPMLTPSYDVLSRELVFRFQALLQPKALYRVELVLPDGGPFGLRAFDDAPLAPGDVPLEWSFFTAGPDVRRVPAAPLPEPSCAEVAALLRPSCADGCCHGGAAPAMGLRLGDPSELDRTAIGRVARQTELGARLGATYENPTRFGTSMPIIDPGSPGTSYLIYKLLLKDENLEPCTQGCEPFGALPGADTCVPLSAAERERLGDWFVRGEPMPLGRGRTLDGECRNVATERHLDCGSLRALSRFISAGASCE